MPLFSVITPVYNTPAKEFREMVQSVIDQSFTDWELILVNDNSPASHVVAELSWATETDDRVRVIHRATNGGISAASNDAVDAAQGTFLVLLDHDDTLTPDALELIAEAIHAQPEADYLYSDEDKISLDGELVDVHRKPPWSPERFRHQMYTCHVSVLRTDLVREVGGFDSSMDGSQDHDIVLKVTERARSVVHIPKVLYHWRVMPGSTALGPQEKPYAWYAGQRAVDAHLKRLNISAEAAFGPSAGHYTINYTLPDACRVSLVIPTRGRVGVEWGDERTYVVEAVRAALSKTSHQNVEVVVVYDHHTTPQSVLDELTELVPAEDLVLLPYVGEFNLSRKYNAGALASSGEVILLMNDDVEPAGKAWLESLVGPVLEKGVGVAGARILSSDSTVQHAGYALSAGTYRDVFAWTYSDTIGHFGVLKSNRECSAIGLTCSAVRREVFLDAGGLNERMPREFADLDFSFKLTRLGYRILYVANSEVFHFSRAPRLDANSPSFAELTNRWGFPRGERDPYLPDF